MGNNNVKPFFKRYYFYVQHPTKSRLIESSSLQEVVRKKHNYKTSPHFEGARISSIFDNNTDMPLLAAGFWNGKRKK